MITLYKDGRSDGQKVHVQEGGPAEARWRAMGFSEEGSKPAKPPKSPEPDAGKNTTDDGAKDETPPKTETEPKQSEEPKPSQSKASDPKPSQSTSRTSRRSR